MTRCKNFEQEIYLYREISPADQEAVKNHLAGCAQCRELFSMVQQAETLISGAASVNPTSENEGRLTGNIMQAIHDQAQKQSVVTVPFPGLFFKYSLAAASLALIVLFVAEQQASPQRSKVAKERTVILTSSSVRDILHQKEKQKPSLYACVKSEKCDNPLVENLKQKKFAHENL